MTLSHFKARKGHVFVALVRKDQAGEEYDSWECVPERRVGMRRVLRCVVCSDVAVMLDGQYPYSMANTRCVDHMTPSAIRQRTGLVPPITNAYKAAAKSIARLLESKGWKVKP